MSKFLSDIAITQFDAMVKAEYQAEGFLLKNTLQTRNNVVGETYKFTKMGQGIARRKPSQDDVTPMNIAYDRPIATLKEWTAPEYTDLFDQQEVNFDEKTQLARVTGMAIGRRSDKIVIDAAEASATANTIAAGGANFTYEKFLEAHKLLNAIGVPRTNRTLILSASAEASLLTEDEFINNQYIRNQVLNASGLHGQTILNTNFIVIPEMKEGALPLTGAIRKNYMYHADSIGIAIGVNFKTTIDWIPEKVNWLTVGIFKAGAVAIDATGIVEISTDET